MWFISALPGSSTAHDIPGYFVAAVLVLGVVLIWAGRRQKRNNRPK